VDRDGEVGQGWEGEGDRGIQLVSTHYDVEDPAPLNKADYLVECDT
jgi:hypothetical protein